MIILTHIEPTKLRVVASLSHDMPTCYRIQQFILWWNLYLVLQHSHGMLVSDEVITNIGPLNWALLHAKILQILSDLTLKTINQIPEFWLLLEPYFLISSHYFSEWQPAWMLCNTSNTWIMVSAQGLCTCCPLEVIWCLHFTQVCSNATYSWRISWSFHLS